MDIKSDCLYWGLASWLSEHRGLLLRLMACGNGSQSLPAIVETSLEVPQNFKGRALYNVALPYLGRRL